MLSPHDRRHLFDALRPPSGYILDQAIGTTFSLDLLALLFAPAAFTFFDLQDAEQRENDNRLELLETMRRYAERIVIFCQAGRIAAPAKHHPLFAYLENSVVEVTAQKPSSAFHPKVWLVRYTSESQPVHYRLLCLSRNMTFDRSWDTVLVLDGELQSSGTQVRNQPLADFVAALPGLSLSKPHERVNETSTQFSRELRRVAFTPPPGFDDLHFWPLGLSGKNRWPFEGKIDRMLIISPFLSAKRLRELTRVGREHLLVSRVDSLAALNPGDLDTFTKIFTLNPAAELEEQDSEELDDRSLQGLHAKLFVADSGRMGRIWTGSANATNAAFQGNIELLVELVGKRERCGIDAILGGGSSDEHPRQREPSFRDLLQPFTPGETADVDTLQQKLEARADEIRMALACAGLVTRVRPADQDQRFILRIEALKNNLTIPPGITVTCRPTTLHESMSCSLQSGAGVLAETVALSIDAITSFIAFQVTVVEGMRQYTCSFVLNLPLLDPPEGRRERLLQHILGNREQVLRFLLMLLADDQSDVRTAFRAFVSSDPRGDTEMAHAAGLPLLEVLLRSLAQRDRTRLDAVASVVLELQKTEEGAHLLPEGFATIWAPIWAAHERRR